MMIKEMMICYKKMREKKNKIKYLKIKMRKKKPDLGAILKKSKKILLIFLKNKYINKIKY